MSPDTSVQQVTETKTLRKTLGRIEQIAPLKTLLEDLEKAENTTVAAGSLVKRVDSALGISQTINEFSTPDTRLKGASATKRIKENQVIVNLLKEIKVYLEAENIGAAKKVVARLRNLPVPQGIPPKAQKVSGPPQAGGLGSVIPGAGEQ